MWKNTADRYGWVSKTLHWVTALLILALIPMGLEMASLPDDDPRRANMYALHKSLGMLVLMLVIVRLVWLRVAGRLALPSGLANWEKGLAKGAKIALYSLMLLVPLSGYVMSTLFGKPVSFFGLFEFPALFAENRAVGKNVHAAHLPLAFTLLAVVVLHLLGALKHRFIDKDKTNDVLRRML